MRYLKRLGLMPVALLCALALAAVSATAQENAPGDGARRITPEEVRVALDKGEAVIVDVRGEGAYTEGHVRGALLIPFDKILSRTDELPRDKMIITYCSWPSEHTSAGAVLNLRTKGINNAAAVLGGYQALVRAGFPIETGPAKPAAALQTGATAGKSVQSSSAQAAAASSSSSAAATEGAAAPAKQARRRGRKTRH